MNHSQSVSLLQPAAATMSSLSRLMSAADQAAKADRNSMTSTKLRSLICRAITSATQQRRNPASMSSPTFAGRKSSRNFSTLGLPNSPYATLLGVDMVQPPHHPFGTADLPVTDTSYSQRILLT
jgi:hypothetical protein